MSTHREAQMKHVATALLCIGILLGAISLVWPGQMVDAEHARLQGQVALLDQRVTMIEAIGSKLIWGMLGAISMSGAGTIMAFLTHRKIGR